MGTAKRLFLSASDKHIGPGPNSYNIKSLIFDKPPRFHIGHRYDGEVDLKKKQNVPGPGQYTINKVILGQKPPLYSMGVKLRSSFDTT